MEIEWRLIKSSAYRSRLRFLRERRIDFVDIIIILMMTSVGISHKTLHSLYKHNVILTLRPAPGTTDGPLRAVPHPLPVCELCADPELVHGAVPVTARQGEFLQVDPA